MTDKIRFVLNTHEQILHPSYLSKLVHQCTSAEEKSHSQLALCLKEEIGINHRACDFLIFLAQKMDIVEKNLHWGDRGWVISRLPTLSTNNHNLTQEEKIAYLKYYLDTDGALIINFLSELAKFGNEGFNISKFLNEGGVERVFVKTAEEYMADVFDIAPRFELSKLLSSGERGYSGKVRTDKFLPHLGPLIDLGFIEKTLTGNLVTYTPKMSIEGNKTVNCMLRLLEEFDSVRSLDSIFSESGDYFHKAAKSYGLKAKEIGSDDYEILKNEIIRVYDEIKDEFFRMARLESIYDIVCIRLLFAPYNKICELKDVSSAIYKMKSVDEEKIRLHVNDMGIIKYMTMAKDYVETNLKLDKTKNSIPDF